VRVNRKRGRHHTAPSRRGIAARFMAAFVLAVLMSLVLGPPGRTDRDWRDVMGALALVLLAVVLTSSAADRCIERFEAAGEQLDDWLAETYGALDVRGDGRQAAPYRGDLRQVPPPGESPFQADFPAWAEATRRLDAPPMSGREGVSAAALRPIAVPVFRNEVDRDAWAARHDVPTEILPIMPDSTS
jgi:hypothetical protein